MFPLRHGPTIELHTILPSPETSSPMWDVRAREIASLDGKRLPGLDVTIDENLCRDS